MTDLRSRMLHEADELERDDQQLGAAFLREAERYIAHLEQQMRDVTPFLAVHGITWPQDHV